MNRRRRPVTGVRKIQARNRAWNLAVNKDRRKLERNHFRVNDAIHITDPSYPVGIPGGLFHVSAKPGQWVGRVHRKDEGPWGNRIASLVVHHIEHASDATFPHWKRFATIGVDSGQAGIFAAETYSDDCDDPTDTATFYGKACAITLSKPHHGAFQEGYVSQSGLGDGVYPVRVVYRRGRIVAVRIDFL